jgi:hypothetical protein
VSRNTGTGAVLERMVLPALEQGGYSYAVQFKVGDRLGGGKHIVDAIVEKDGLVFLVSLKWQQVSGTAEQKVPFEIICLLSVLESGSYTKAYLVLGGEGWTLRTLYTTHGLSKHISYKDRIEIVTLESFVGRANSGRL